MARASRTCFRVPALYLAKLFGSDDTEGIVRLITALLVLVLDPLAVLLTLAAARLPYQATGTSADPHRY